MTEFRLFGPVQLWTADGQVDLGPAKQRTVLAALAADAGQPVSTETLIDRVWDDDPPAGVRSVLYTYVSRLRRVLGNTATIGSRGAGYVLDVDRDLVDLHRFRSLVDRARNTTADTDRAALLRRALDLWHGEPLADLSGDWVDRIRTAWRARHVDAVIAWAGAEPDPATVIGPLTELAAEHPLAESLTAALMRALHTAGRSAEALDRYATLRRRLADQLGTDPSAELQDLHQTILRREPAQPAVPGRKPAPSTPAVPAQLPLDVYGFTGRVEHLARLDAILEQADEQPTTVMISALWGTAGVGKTALAVHWGHRVADRFPDGQLFANLRGFGPEDAPVSPEEALRGFLDALGVPPQRIPAGLSAQASMYRSLLAGRRMLIVLDNARDAEQVRPLLPGGRGCVVVVTTRSQLAGLVASAGAHPIALDLLTSDEARTLLARRIGRDRVAAEPDAVDAVIHRCARLPLALTVAAGRATIHPHLTLAALADELRAVGQSLDALNGNDPATDARIVFSWSYRALSTDAARLFRLLGLHPGPDISVAAAASLTGTPAAKVRPLLTELVRNHLLAEDAIGRYSFHDLLRAYAIELVHATDGDDDRGEAFARLLDYYRFTAQAAELALRPTRERAIVPEREAKVAPGKIGDTGQALDWFSLELPSILAVFARAAESDHHREAVHLAVMSSFFLDTHGHWDELIQALRTAVACARRQGDRSGEAFLLRELARIHTRLDHYDEADDNLRRAIEVYDDIGDRTGQAYCHLYRCWPLERQGRHAEALDHALRSLEVFRTTERNRRGQRAGEARALNSVGWYHAQLGNHQQTVGYCTEALGLFQDQELNDRDGLATTWDSLGYAHHCLGDDERAIACYRESLDIYREIDDVYNAAETLSRLGDTLLGTGDRDAARDAWQRAYEDLQLLDHDDARILAEKLDRLDRQPTSSTP